MATSIADGWLALSAEIGTDIDKDNAVYLSGETSIVFLDTQSNTDVALVSDWMPLDDWNADPEHGDQRFDLSVVFASGSFTDDVHVDFETANADKTSTTLTEIYRDIGSYLYLNVFTSFGRGGVAIPSDARWGRIRITRPGPTYDGKLWIDKAYLNPSPVLGIGQSAAPIAFTAAWAAAVVSADTGEYNRMSSFNQTKMRLVAPGYYQVSGHVTIEDSVDAGDMFGIRIYHEEGGKGVNYLYGSTLTIPAAHVTTEPLSMNVSGMIKVESIHSTGDGANSYNYHRIWIEVIQHTGTLVNYAGARLTAIRIAGE